MPGYIGNPPGRGRAQPPSAAAALAAARLRQAAHDASQREQMRLAQEELETDLGERFPQTVKIKRVKREG